ncbi:MAG: hypothetical protein ACYST6_12145 [Planctomycetota bacterium]|jgi:hypothetical protein
MKTLRTFTKKDAAVLLCCVVFALASLGAVGSAGRRRAKQMVCLSNLLQWGRIWKSYTDDHDGYFPRRGGWNEPSMVSWPLAILQHMPDINRKLWFCPEATKPWMMGGRCPFAAWTAEYDDLTTIESSYCVNLWLATPGGDGRDTENFWRTPYVADAASIPLLLDGSWKDAEPYHLDEPPPSREWIQANCWEPNMNEMKRVCHYRHESTVNGVFLDLSARKIGLKELWVLKWHRLWPEGTDHLPAWPPWMENFEDP